MLEDRISRNIQGISIAGFKKNQQRSFSSASATIPPDQEVTCLPRRAHRLGMGSASVQRALFGAAPPRTPSPETIQATGSAR